MSRIIFSAAKAAAAALCAAAFLTSTCTAGDIDWPADVQFTLPEFNDPACVPCSHCDSCGASGCNCCSAGCGYCYSGPCLADGMMARFTSLAERMEAGGVIYDPSITQFYQGVTDGGVDRGFEYGGKVDQYIILDSCKLGLWHGTTMTMHVETRFGGDVNREAVALAPVNVAMLYPNADEHDTAITDLSFAQALSDDWQLAFGKFNALDMFYGLYPETGRGVTSFMNTSIALPLAVARVIPLSFLGAGVIKLQDGKPQASVLVYDTHNIPTTSGFDELFDNGANIFAYWRFFTNLGGLPGSHLFGGIASTGDFISADPAGFVIIPGEGLVSVPRQEGSWAAIYILEQTIWADRCNAARNVSVLSQWSIADEETSPFAWTGNFTVQAHGLNCRRPHDTFGVGYFYTGLSDFRILLDPIFELDDVHGGELFYNMAVTKCLQLTADLQVIEPAEVGNDTAIVFGLRAYMGI